MIMSCCWATPFAIASSGAITFTLVMTFSSCCTKPCWQKVRPFNPSHSLVFHRLCLCCCLVRLTIADFVLSLSSYPLSLAAHTMPCLPKLPTTCFLLD